MFERWAVFVIAGVFLVWAVAYLAKRLPQPWQSILLAIACVACLIWLLYLLGLVNV